MKRILTAILVVTLLATTTASAEGDYTLEPKKHMDVPSFLGYVPDRFIVILNNDITVDHRKTPGSQ